MTTIVWPSSRVPQEIQFGIRFNVQVSTSDLDGSVQTVELPGARWTMSISMTGLERNEGSAEMEAFLAQLRGGANRARVPVFKRLTPRGGWAGSPAVDNEVGSPTLSQTGNTLWARGFTPFTTVKAGDYFNVGTNGQLLMLTADGMADSSGLLQLSVEPAIRSAPSHLTALVSSNPVVPLMILTDPHSRWRLSPGDEAMHALDLVEVFE